MTGQSLKKASREDNIATIIIKELILLIRKMSEPEKKETPTTKEDASRIQSAEAKKNDGKVEKGSFAARAQHAADTNVNKGIVPPPGDDK